MARNLLYNVFLLFYVVIIIVYMYMMGAVSYENNVKARAELYRVASLVPLGSENQTQVTRFGAQASLPTEPFCHLAGSKVDIIFAIQ